MGRVCLFLPQLVAGTCNTVALCSWGYNAHSPRLQAILRLTRVLTLALSHPVYHTHRAHTQAHGRMHKRSRNPCARALAGALPLASPRCEPCLRAAWGSLRPGTSHHACGPVPPSGTMTGRCLTCCVQRWVHARTQHAFVLGCVCVCVSPYVCVHLGLP